MQRKTKLRGRLWVLRHESELFSDIDTDMIYHNAHLAVTEIDRMGQYALGNLEGYEDFAAEARSGDLVLAGDNFGSGSSRQHAVDCFKALGVQAVVARSFGAIYKRNAINSGFPVVEIPDLPNGGLKHLDDASVDLEKGILVQGEREFRGKPMSEVALEIYRAGGLFQYASEAR
ncbi:MAG: 3-isopropylmalate dehydratase [Candidatus Aegiribacteria sp.]|nr:3-isopropylmalate dehydratase [Candidatus Aegiribacteria sp.]MBD3295528.1 3-isopropylmalate dehydratase [Candidatus Fermentibacteria bacterium]